MLVAGGRAQAAGTLLLGLPLATKLQPDQGMYASVLPVLVGSAAASVRDLELAGELLRALAHAPPGKDAKSPAKSVSDMEAAPQLPLSSLA